MQKNIGSKKCQLRQANRKKSISLALALTESERETDDRDSENCKDGNEDNTEIGKSGNDDSLVCDQCGKDDFKSKTGLLNHVRIVHKNKTQNKLRKVKGLETIDKSRRLSNTLPVQTEYCCKKCGLKCSTTVGLKMHMMKCKQN